MGRFTYALFILAILCVLPFAELAFYSHPALDDFALSVYLRTTNLLAHTQIAYLTHSGRYAASLASFVFLLHSAHPEWYGYQILAFIMLGALSLFGAASGLAAGPKVGRQWLLPGSMVVIVGFSNFPWPAEGLFWLTGAQAYFTSVLLSCWLLLLAWGYAAPARRPLAWGASAVLSFFIPGFSEIWAILLPLVGGAVLLAGGRRPVCREAYWVLGAGLLGSALTLAAPGNFQRLHQQAGWSPIIGYAVGRGVGGTGYLLVNWLANGMLLVASAMVWPLSQAVARYSGRSFLNRLTNRPMLWPAVLVLGLFGAMFFCFLATHAGPAPRVKNLLYFYFLFCWFLGLHALGRTRSTTGEEVLGWPRAWRYGLSVALGCFLLTDHNLSLRHERIGQATSSVVQAYRDWLSGSAARYDQQQRARVDQVRAARPRTGVLRLDPLRERPLTLFYYDISANEKLWGNVAYAEFYGGPPVVVAPPAPRR